MFNSIYRKFRWYQIQKLLENKNITVEDLSKLENDILSNSRYIYTIIKQDNEDRFLKISLFKKDRPQFKRQIDVTNYLYNKKVIDIRKIYDSNVGFFKPSYLISESFPTGKDQIGFIDKGTKSKEGVSQLSKSHAESCFEKIKHLNLTSHKVDKKFKKELIRYDKDIDFQYEKLLKRIKSPVNSIEIKKELPLYEVFEIKSGVKKIYKKSIKIMDQTKKSLAKYDDTGLFFTHGDLSPDNLYAFDNGKVELLDYEWFGYTTNPYYALIIDYGNLRARSWANKVFVKELDNLLREHFKSINKVELGELIIEFIILRSHSSLSKFFENYDYSRQSIDIEKERKQATEEDLFEMLKNYKY